MEALAGHAEGLLFSLEILGVHSRVFNRVQKGSFGEGLGTGFNMSIYVQIDPVARVLAY